MIELVVKIGDICSNFVYYQIGLPLVLGFMLVGDANAYYFLNDEYDVVRNDVI